MSTNKKILLRLIVEEVEKALLEQAPAPAPASPPEDSLAPDAPDAGGEADPEGGDLDLGGGDMDLGAEGGDLGGDDMDLGAEGEEGIEGEEGADDFGDGGGFGGLGGGGGFGDDGEPGLDPDQEGEEDVLTTVGPEDVEIPADPVGAITDDAIQMLAQTRQAQPILRNVKAQIQKYFDDFEDATPVIKSLWDTESIVLRDVARRLLLFIKGV